ncbi:MAG: LysM peptidoglycan-binding domain-containing protein [Anaerolineae bacterium]
MTRPGSQKHALLGGALFGLSLLALLIAPSTVLGAGPAYAQGSCGDTVTVVAGDTLARVAARCGTTVQAILAANPTIENPNLIYVGQAIEIPGGQEATPTATPTSTSSPTPTPMPTSTPTPTTYVVQPGDTLTRIARRFGTTVDAILADNPTIENPNLIYVSQVIQIPTGTGLASQVKIYLVALEDQGQSGQEIGCGDSLVPVEVQVTPTRAPLTAALRALLAIKTETYGESGLYDSLYQSNLTVQSVAIVDRTAIIRLTGEVQLGGTCDTPRFEGQIEATALQFSTVDTAQVFINGQSMADVLSLK